MDIPNCFYRISIKALILDEQKRFLLCKEDNGIRELPGGGLDHGEDPKAGLHREILEEMGLVVTSISEQPQYFISFQGENAVRRANVLYLITVKDLNFTISDECVEIGFFTKEEASKLPVFSNVTAFLQEFDPANH